MTPASDERFYSSIRRAAPADAMTSKRDNDTSVRARADGCTIGMGRGQNPMRMLANIRLDRSLRQGC